MSHAWHVDPVGGPWLAGSLAVLMLLMVTLVGVPRDRLTRGRRAALTSLRIVAALLAIMALWRPSLVHTEMREQSGTLVLLVDRSRSMLVADAFGGRTRWQSLVDALRESLPALADFESRNLDLRVYTFAADVQNVPWNEGRPKWPESPDGEQTAIGSALEEVLRREAGKRLLGVVLLSDGAQRAYAPRDLPPQTPARRLADLGFPLYAVAFGQARGQGQARDVAIKDLIVNQTVFVKNELDVLGTARIDGLVNQRVPVQLLFESPGGKMDVVETKELQSAQDGAALPIELSYVPSTPGEYKLTLRAEKQPGEIVTTNNELSTFVTVLKGGLNVLYIEGALRVEQKFLRRSLDASADIKLDYIRLAERDPRQRRLDLAPLFARGKYDVYVLGDVDSAAFRPEELAALAKVVGQGAGLLALGGLHSFGPGGYGASPLADVLPVAMTDWERQLYGDKIRPDVHLKGPLKMRPAPRAGARHFVTQLAPADQNRDAWEHLPALEGANKFERLKPSAQVLAESAHGEPLLVAGEAGGRVLAMAADSTWHWWLEGHEAEHKRFWRQAVLWLARKDETTEGNVWIRLERRRFAPGSRVEFGAGARSPHGEILTDAQFEAEVILPDGKHRPLHLARAGEEMTGLVSDTQQAGDYTIVASASHHGDALGTAKARFLIYEQDLELDNAAADPTLLASLAKMSEQAGGRLLAPEELPTLVKEIEQQPLGSEVEREVQETPWDTWPFFALFVGVLSADWYLRKRWGWFEHAHARLRPATHEFFSLIAKTFAGLEGVLADELAELGAREVVAGRRMVGFVGDRELLYRANLWCRTAVRILRPIAECTLEPADVPRSLHAGLSHIQWDRYLHAQGTLAIDPVVHSPLIDNSLYAAQVAKDAIADWFRSRHGHRPNVDRHNPDLRINLHIAGQAVTVYLDASGDSLHKRGYRPAVGEAPLSEVLAAGILRLAGWDRRAPLVDFLCGSGTLPIEAALWAWNIAPGTLGRTPGYARWPDFDRNLHERLLREARAAETRDVPLVIRGSDLDARVLELAVQNAKRAGVNRAVRFDVANFDQVQPPAEPGLVVVNPPYDERMSVEHIGAFYRRMGDVLKRQWAGYTAWVFTGNLQAARQIGLRTAARIPLRNGPIECRLLKFPLIALVGKRLADPESTDPNLTEPEPTEPAVLAAVAVEPAASPAGTAPPARGAREPASAAVRAPAPARHPASSAMDATVEAFRHRLRRMGRHYSRWARRQDIECYRLYDRDIPEVPLSIDRYADALYVVEQARPHDRSGIEQQAWFERLVDAAAVELAVPRERVWAHGRERTPSRGERSGQERSREQSRVEVREAGLTFEVQLSSRGETGLALDERLLRERIRREAAAGRFLDWFGAAGVNSVVAAAGGARQTHSLAAAPGLAEWSRRNLARGGFGPPDHAVVDARSFEPGEEKFELVYVAPPAGLHRRDSEAWDPRAAYRQLLASALALLAPGGRIYFVSRVRRFRLLDDDVPGCTLRELTRQTTPPDFRDRPAHRCWSIERA